MKKMNEPSKWHIKVEHLMACNCNCGCPCTFESPPTYGTCEAALGYHIKEGKYGTTKLDGLRWVTAAIWPGPLHERKGRAVIYLDQRASRRQREGLELIATGKAGGPIGIFMSTVTEGMDIHTARIEFKMSGEKSRLKIQDLVNVAFDWIRNPVTGSKHESSVSLPTGMLTKQERYYSAKEFAVDAGPLCFTYPDRHAMACLGDWKGP